MRKKMRTGGSTEAGPGVRLQKRLAELGVASRREGERLIAAGRVAVNGAVVTELGTRVGETDVISVDGKEVAVSAGMTVVLHKPRGVICARQDPQGRPTVYDLFPPDLPYLGHVGRLDFNTEGVLLLTNVPGLAEALLRPGHGVPRTYEAKIRGHLSAAGRRALEAGVPLDGRPTRPVIVERMHGHRSKHDWIRLTLFEGKNRHIHRILEAVGHTVTRLKRVSFAGVSVDGLPVGRWRPVSPGELQRLWGFAKQTGPRR